MAATESKAEAGGKVTPPRPNQGQQQGQPRGAVSNHTYDIVSMFQSKLEALAAYDRYAQDLGDDEEAQRILDAIRADDERHVTLLRDHIEKMCRENRFR